MNCNDDCPGMALSGFKVGSHASLPDVFTPLSMEISSEFITLFAAECEENSALKNHPSFIKHGEVILFYVILNCNKTDFSTAAV